MLFQHDRLLRFFKKLFETGIAPQRVPPREQFQPTIAERAWETDDTVQFFKSEILVADAGCDHCQICHPKDSLRYIFFRTNKFDCTPAFTQRFLFSSEIGVDQPSRPNSLLL